MLAAVSCLQTYWKKNEKNVINSFRDIAIRSNDPC